MTGITELLQLGVFRLGLREDRDVGVGVFPQGEEQRVVFDLARSPIMARTLIAKNARYQAMRPSLG